MLLSTIDFVPAQSLAEAARKEAERRKSLEQIPSKTIVLRGTAPPAAPGKAQSTAKSPPSEGKRPSAAHYRAELEKLQQEIVRTQERLDSAKKRLELEKNIPVRFNRNSMHSGASLNQQRLQTQVQELESRLARLREERRKIYDEGRKAGFLPGELDGKGITP
jgi:hypothetical protein